MSEIQTGYAIKHKNGEYWSGKDWEDLTGAKIYKRKTNAEMIANSLYAADKIIKVEIRELLEE